MMHFAANSSQRRRLLLLLTLVLAVSERAIGAEDSGAYVGGNFGRARNNYDTNSIDATLMGDAISSGDTLAITKRSTSRLSDAWSLDVGYFFNAYIGLEAAFLHVGEIRYIAVGNATTSSDTLAIASTTEVTSHGPALSVVFRLPLVEALEADLKVGDYFGKTTFDNDTIVGASGGFIAPTTSTSSLLAGVGVAYSVAGHYLFRVDYLRIQKAGDVEPGVKFNVNLVTLGVSYSF